MNIRKAQLTIDMVIGDEIIFPVRFIQCLFIYMIEHLQSLSKSSCSRIQQSQLTFQPSNFSRKPFLLSQYNGFLNINHSRIALIGLIFRIELAISIEEQLRIVLLMNQFLQLSDATFFQFGIVLGLLYSPIKLGIQFTDAFLLSKA